MTPSRVILVPVFSSAVIGREISATKAAAPSAVYLKPDEAGRTKALTAAVLPEHASVASEIKPVLMPFLSLSS